MAKFTKKDLKEIRKRWSNDKLTKRVIDIMLNRGGADDIECFIKDLEYGGCCSGMVGELIYYCDTKAFYKTYQEEINELLYDTLNECGFKSCFELFGKKWDDEDVLAIDTTNQNLLAWFGFEETVRKIAQELGVY